MSSKLEGSHGERESALKMLIILKNGRMDMSFEHIEDNSLKTNLFLWLISAGKEWSLR